MKNYEKLIVPEDSAWCRKTLSARAWRILHWRIRSLLTGCKNIIRWSPTIFKDRDWDHWYITSYKKKLSSKDKKLSMQIDRLWLILIIVI